MIIADQIIAMKMGMKNEKKKLVPINYKECQSINQMFRVFVSISFHYRYLWQPGIQQAF
jgi:hypothetical protein